MNNQSQTGAQQLSVAPKRLSMSPGIGIRAYEFGLDGKDELHRVVALYAVSRGAASVLVDDKRFGGKTARRVILDVTAMPIADVIAVLESTVTDIAQSASTATR